MSKQNSTQSCGFDGVGLVNGILLVVFISLLLFGTRDISDVNIGPTTI